MRIGRLSWAGALIVGQMGAAGLLLLPGYLMEGAASFTPANATMILYTAIAGSIIAPFVWMSAVKHLGAGRTAIFMNLIPVVTAVVAALFPNEALHVYHLIGGGMAWRNVCDLSPACLRAKACARCAVGISRKSGYKIFNRFKDDGLEALSDRSQRPVRYANQLPEPVEAMIVRLKKEKPHWGARKIRELLVKRLAGDVRQENGARRA